MPRKFKLIKEYPGSVELGSVATFNTKMDLYGIANHPFLYPKEIVENQPEFWEEIIEIDYQILEVKSTKKGGNIFKRLHDGVFNCWNTDMRDSNIERHINGGSVTIHSIKRLSDDKIFTIGDRVDGTSHKNIMINEIWLNPDCSSQILFNHKDEGIDLFTAKKSADYEILSWYFGDMHITTFPDGSAREYRIYSVKRLSDGEIFTIRDDTRHGFIKKFYIKDNFLLANASLEPMPIHLSGLEKMKILFCTKDGIEVRKNDTIWCIRSGFRVEESIASKETNFLGPIFHCEKTAEEYALLNKPCLSINEINNFLQVENSTDWKYTYSSRLYMEKIKAFVKSKS